MVGNVSMADFLSACGATGPVEVDLEDTTKQEVVHRVFDQPFLVLGRDPHADLQLVDDDVSRRHAYLQVIGGNIYCVDLLSRTQLHWAHGSGRFGWLTPTQAVRVGPFNIRLTGGVPADPLNAFTDWDPLAKLPPELGSLPIVILENLETSHRQVRWVRWRMSRALALVGQSDDCNLCIREGTVSRHCCSLVNTPAGVWIVDLLGRPGTFVNEKPVRWAYLNDGDSLRMGDLVLNVRYKSTRFITTGSQAISQASPVAPTTTLVSKSDQGPCLEHGPPSVWQPIPTPSLSSAGYQELAVGMHLGNEALSSVLGPLANQFSLMQQQMFDQFMQALLAMGQMFGQLQRDQLNSIRDELTRVQQVSQDLQMLQMELARRELGGGEAGGIGPAETRPEWSASLPELEAKPDAPSTPESNGPLINSPPETATVANGEGQMPPPAPVSDGPEKADWRGGKSDQEVHAQLSQRVLSLKQERESLWHELIRRLTGR